MIQAITGGATQLRLTPHTEARLLELGLITRRGRELTVTAAGRRASNPLFEEWL